MSGKLQWQFTATRPQTAQAATMTIILTTIPVMHIYMMLSYRARPARPSFATPSVA